MADDAQGHGHLLTCYRTPNYYGAPYDVVDLNVATGVVRIFPATLGRPLRTMWLAHSNGKWYLGADDPSRVYEYDPVTGAGQVVVANTSARCIYSVGEAVDGTVIFGGLGTRHCEYNPATGVFKEYNAIANKEYAYRTVPDPLDARYVYFLLAYDERWIAVWDRETESATVLFQGSGYTDIQIGQTAEGKVGLIATPTAYFDLSHGVLAARGTAPNLLPAVNPFRDSPAAWALFWNTEVDYSQAIPTNFTPSATIKYRVNGGAWNDVPVSGLSLENIPLFRTVAADGLLYLIPRAYYPITAYDPAAHTFSQVGWTGSSVYRTATAGDFTCLAGYYSQTFRWNRAQAWTLYPNHPAPETANPALIYEGDVDREVTIDADGDAWIGTQYTRTASGVQIAQYHHGSGVVWTLSAGLETATIYGLTAVGAYVVASVSGALWVINRTTHEVERQLVGVAGEDDQGTLIAASSTDVIGLAAYTAYRINAATGAVLWSKTFASRLFGPDWTYTWEREASLSADGYIWLYIGDVICKLSPTDGNVIQVATENDPGNIYSCGARRFIINQSDTTLRELIV